MLWRIPADTHEQRIGVMGILFSVVLSVAKDLIAARYRHEILRYAQDDGVNAATFDRNARSPAMGFSPAVSLHASRLPLAYSA